MSWDFLLIVFKAGKLKGENWLRTFNLEIWQNAKNTKKSISWSIYYSKLIKRCIVGFEVSMTLSKGDIISLILALASDRKVKVKSYVKFVLCGRFNPSGWWTFDVLNTLRFALNPQVVGFSCYYTDVYSTGCLFWLLVCLSCLPRCGMWLYGAR